MLPFRMSVPKIMEWSRQYNTVDRSLHDDSPHVIGHDIRIFVTIHSDGRPHDGELNIYY